MTRLKAGIRELLPDVWQVGLLRAEEVNSLSASDLRVQIVCGLVSHIHAAGEGTVLTLLSDLSEDNESIWSDFPTSHTRDNREGTIALQVHKSRTDSHHVAVTHLNIRHETVIGVLILVMDRVHDMFVPERR
jgi:hypothetical protein